MTDRQFTLSSGRKIGVSALDEALSMRMIVMCHPMRGAGDFDPNPILSRNHELRILAVDRPGYGGSEPLREGDPSCDEAHADDIAEFLSSTKMQGELVNGPNFGAVGWGFDGAVALSLAAHHLSVIARTAIEGSTQTRGRPRFHLSTRVRGHRTGQRQAPRRPERRQRSSLEAAGRSRGKE